MLGFRPLGSAPLGASGPGAPSAPILAAVAATLNNFTLSASATVTAPPGGIASITMAAFTLTATGQLSGGPRLAFAAITMGNFVLSATGVRPIPAVTPPNRTLTLDTSKLFQRVLSFPSSELAARRLSFASSRAAERILTLVE